MIIRKTLREVITLFDSYKLFLNKEEFNELLRKKHIGIVHRYSTEVTKLLDEFLTYYEVSTGNKLEKNKIINKAIENTNIQLFINELNSFNFAYANCISCDTSISLSNGKKILKIQDKSELNRDSIINYVSLKYLTENSFDKIIIQLYTDEFK